MPDETKDEDAGEEKKPPEPPKGPRVDVQEKTEFNVNNPDES